MPFRTRSFEQEYLDRKEIAAADLYRNLEELNSINRLLGGYHVSVKGLRKVLRSGKHVRIFLDIGCGGGDGILQLSRSFPLTKYRIFFHGVDKKDACIAYAENNLSGIPNRKLHCIDYRFIPPTFYDSVDVVHCSLLLHHLGEDEIVRLFRTALLHDCAIVVNDLHRNWFAYYSIKLLTTLFSKSWLVKNDAPVSVTRGFSRKELESLVRKAGYKHYEIKWCWAFRYLVVAYP